MSEEERSKQFDLCITEAIRLGRKYMNLGMSRIHKNEDKRPTKEEWMLACMLYTQYEDEVSSR